MRWMLYWRGRLLSDWQRKYKLKCTTTLPVSNTIHHRCSLVITVTGFQRTIAVIVVFLSCLAALHDQKEERRTQGNPRMIVEEARSCKLLEGNGNTWWAWVQIDNFVSKTSSKRRIEGDPERDGSKTGATWTCQLLRTVTVRAVVKVFSSWPKMSSVPAWKSHLFIQWQCLVQWCSSFKTDL